MNFLRVNSPSLDGESGSLFLFTSLSFTGDTEFDCFANFSGLDSVLTDFSGLLGFLANFSGFLQNIFRCGFGKIYSSYNDNNSCLDRVSIKGIFI